MWHMAFERRHGRCASFVWIQSCDDRPMANFQLISNVGVFFFLLHRNWQVCDWLIRADRPEKRRIVSLYFTYCGTCICSHRRPRCRAAGCILTWRRARKRETSSVGTFACNWKKNSFAACQPRKRNIPAKGRRENWFLFPHTKARDWGATVSIFCHGKTGSPLAED